MTNMNESMHVLLDRGNIALEDKEWTNAAHYFDLALNHDARCGDAYLGLVFAENKCATLEKFISARLAQYAEVGKILYEACPVDTETINAITVKYCVGNFLTQQYIESLFVYDRTFTSETQGHTSSFNTEMTYIKGNAKINRARQFLEGDKKTAFETALKKIIIELNSRIEIAKKYDQKKVELISESYAAFIKEKTAYVETISAEAAAARHKLYEETVEQQNKAASDQEYYQAAQNFDTVGVYLDAAERAAACRNKADEIIRSRNEEIKKEKKRKIKKIFIIIAACIILIIAGLVTLSSLKANRIQEAMIGQDFSGVYHYDGNSYYDCEQYVDIYIIDEEYCRIDIEEDQYTYSDGYSSNHSSDEKVKYNISGGLFKIRFNWESNKVREPVSPFIVTEEDGYINLYTENFNSHTSLSLSN